MKVSEYFNLNRTQAELDFVNVDIYGDVRVFVDPRALRLLDTEWGAECVHLIQSCFKVVLDALGRQDEESAIRILSALKETNETHLGLSRDRARGSGLLLISSFPVAGMQRISTYLLFCLMMLCQLLQIRNMTL